MKLYSVYDKKSMIYGQIMTCQDEIQAKRLFERAVNDEETMLFHYPEDFVLVEICDFDEHSGNITTMPMPKQILEAQACFPIEK